MRRLSALALVAVAAACGGARAAPLPPGCHVGVYFRADATRAQIEAVRHRLERNARVARVVFVSKVEALRIMKRRHPELTRILKRNPFPDALLVHPRTRDDYVPIVRSLGPRPAAVQAVLYPRFGPCAARR